MAQLTRLDAVSAAEEAKTPAALAQVSTEEGGDAAAAHDDDRMDTAA
jgi:hypothetical protein